MKPAHPQVTEIAPTSSLFDAKLMQRWLWELLLLWTVISGLGLFFDLRQESSEAEESARIEVRAHLNEHVQIREWAAIHGGVYVPVDQYTKANPYLEGLVVDRDITTPSGVQLTLINPAYLTRQLLEIGRRHGHPFRVRLTSLRPINPANSADPWERNALASFEHGVEEISSVDLLNEQAYMRLMQPLTVKNACLQCHADQGYQVGDIRGGISVSVPMKPHFDVANEHKKHILVIHISIWLIGCLGIFIGMRRFLRRLHENAMLQTTLHKLSSALEQAGEAVLITDQHGYIEYANPAFEQLSAWSVADVLGRTPLMLRPRTKNHVQFRNMWQQINKGHSWQHEHTIRTKNGKILHTLVSVAPVYDNKQLGKPCNFVGIIRDITHEHSLEANLRQMQKMESLGVLVGGIAHDFNNVLAGILGHLYLAKTSLEADSPSVNSLNKAEELGFRASSMISQLLAFARRDNVSMQRMDIAPFLNEAIKLASVSVPESVRLDSQVTLTTPISIFGDPTQLQQILMNLLNNARDALENVKNPRISIKLEPFTPNSFFLKKHSLSTDAFVLLTIQDNGTGITKQDQENIFEPFFTTKASDKGTGLGLSMVYGAIRTHGGVIEVESEVDHGTTFKVYLPALELPRDEQKQAVERPLVEQGQGECVLLVDDDAPLRESLAALLKSMNYNVVEAKDGKQAVSLFLQHQEEISLVMLDLVMPNMGGVETAKEIRSQRSELPMIFMTGYDRKQSWQKDEGFEHAVLLTKPFDIYQLSHCLRQLIS